MSGFFHNYPYTDAHELNLDWILRKIKEIAASVEEFEALTKITFSGEWDITQQYPAWTVVNDNGIGYISIQPVPKGVLLSNNDYWRIVADYTAIIAGLQNRVVILEGQMSTAQTDITNLKADKAINKPNLKDGCYILIGDSYGEGWDPDGGNDGWCKIFGDKLGLDSDHLKYNGYGGSRFAAGGTMAFLTQLQNYITVTDPNKVTDIIVAGGFNDQSASDGDIGTGIADFVSYARTTYPFAKIHIAAVGWTEDTLNGSGGTATTAKCTAVYNSYKKYCIINGVHFIPYAVKWAMTQNFASDFVHPTQNGNTVIAENLILGLNGDDSVNLKEAYSPTSISMATGVTTGNVLYTAQEKGDMIEIIGGYSLYVLSSVSYTADEVNGLKLFDSYCPLIKCAYPVFLNCYGFLSTSAGYRNFNGAIKVYNNEWSLIMPDVNSGGYETFTVTGITISGFYGMIPLLNASQESASPL